MRHIGSISDENDATRFGDYLLSAGMKNHVEEGPSGWAVWVEEDDLLDKAKVELESFRANPTDPKYDGASRQAEKIRRDEEKKQERRQQLFRDVRTSWSTPRQWAQPVTMALILLSLLAAAATAIGRNVIGPGANALSIQSLQPVSDERIVTAEQLTRGGYDWQPVNVHGQLALMPNGLPDVRRGQVWRLITPIFLHMGVLHLVFNMFWLRDLGAQIEMGRGSLFMAFLVISSAVISNLAQFYWEASPLFGGMSGVVYALFGYVWIKGRFEPHLGLGVSKQTAMFMIGWMIFCMIMPGMNVANAAHLVGFLVGIGVAYAPVEFRRLRRRLRS